MRAWRYSWKEVIEVIRVCGCEGLWVVEQVAVDGGVSEELDGLVRERLDDVARHSLEIFE